MYLTHQKTTIAGVIGLLFSSQVYATDTSTSAQTDEVVVTATRTLQPKDRIIGDVTIIDRKEIESAGASSIMDLLQRQSGIEMNNNGGLGKTASIRIRGANDNNTIILIDGVRANSATLGTTSIQHIPLSQIEKIEIFRGAASSLYGSEGIGGVIQIFTRHSIGAPTLNVSVKAGSYNTQDVTAGMSGSIDQTDVSIQAGYTRSDGFSATNKKSIYAFSPDRDGYDNKNLSAKIAQHFGQNHELGATLFHADAINHYDSSFFDSVTYTSKFYNYDYREHQLLTAASIYSKNQFTDWWLSTVKFGKGIDDSNSYAPNSTNTASVITSIKTTQDQYSWQNDFSLPVGSLSLGLEKLNQKISATTAYIVKQRSIESAYASWVASIGANDVQLNLRSDNNSQFGQHTTWLAGYGYRFLEGWKASISHATAFNAPTFNQLYYPLDSDGSVGNPNLRAEESRNTELSIGFKNTQHRFKALAYRNEVTNLITWNANPITWAYSPANISTALLEGFSLSGAEYLGNWVISANADIQSPHDAQTGNLLPYRSQRHGNLSVAYKLNDWSFGANMQAESLRYNGMTASRKTLAGYGTLNLTSTYKVNNDWSVQASINNLLDKNYELTYGYNTAGVNAFLGLNYTPSN